jgi:N-acetylmuramoyl-L-alanine amidase
MRRITHIVIHTAGAPKGVDQSAAAIRAYHMHPQPRGRGWRDIGYHFVVRKDGLVELGRPVSHPGAHVEGFNAETIGICFTGHGDLSDFTLAQYERGLQLVRDLQAKHGVPTANVLGHRETTQAGAPPSGKTCPGSKVDMDAFRKRLANP